MSKIVIIINATPSHLVELVQLCKQKLKQKLAFFKMIWKFYHILIKHYFLGLVIAWAETKALENEFCLNNSIMIDASDGFASTILHIP